MVHLSQSCLYDYEKWLWLFWGAREKGRGGEEVKGRCGGSDREKGMSMGRNGVQEDGRGREEIRGRTGGKGWGWRYGARKKGRREEELRGRQEERNGEK